ncbi:MAG: hypothetical protein RR205_02395 [Oscillospiraceae bacterium]
MLIQINQIKSGICPEYRLISDGRFLSAKQFITHGNGRRLTVSQYNDPIYTLDYAWSKRIYSNIASIWGGKRCCVKVLNRHYEEIGLISKQNQGGLFGFAQYDFRFGERNYQTYAIERGKMGLSMVLYCNNNAVAMVCKPVVVTDMFDQYVATAANETDLMAAALFALYYDMLYHTNMSKYVINAKASTITYSGKHIMAYFDEGLWAKMQSELKSTGLSDLF